MFRKLRRKQREAALDNRLRQQLPGPFHFHQCVFVHIPKAAGTSVSLALFGHQVGHSTIRDWYSREFEPTREYFKFSFVRHPVDRLLSAFRFMQAGGMTPRNQEYAKRLDGLDFPAFVRRIGEFQDAEHFRPQYTFLCGPDNRLLVNFVGRFESLEDDFLKVGEVIGFKGALPHLNQGTEKPEVDPETRQLVREFYATDFVMFGY